MRSFTHLALCRPFDVKADGNADADGCEEGHRGDREARTKKPTIMKIEDAEADADQQEGERTNGRVQLRFPGRAFGPE